MRAILALLILLHVCDAQSSSSSSGIDSTLLALRPSIGYGGQTFGAALHIAPPFVQYDNTKIGNDRFSGFTVDFMMRLGTVLDLNWTFTISEKLPESADEAIAQIGPSGVDLATGMIHITHNRTKALRFTMPFYFSGFLLVIQMPADEPQPFSFFAPFDSMLWLAIVLEILLVAVTFFFLECPELSPAEESDLVEGYTSSVLDAFYWSLSAFTATLDKAPHTWGGKLVMLGHGWFMLIILASYTANLASFLTTAALVPSITGWQDLTVPGNTYTLAIPGGQSHQRFLEFEEYHYGYKFPNVIFTDTFEQAFQLVANGTADATFEDQPVAQYYLQNTAVPCTLMEVGNLFAPVGYGIAFAPDREPDQLQFSEAVIYLTEIGELEKLNTKYNIGARNSIDNSQCGVNASGVLTVPELYGLMIMTGCLIVLGLLVNAAQKKLFPKKAEKVAPEEVVLSPEAAEMREIHALLREIQAEQLAAAARSSGGRKLTPLPASTRTQSKQ